jgi:rubrerythrin
MRNTRERAIKVLQRALRLEYRAIFLYRIHARALQNAEVKRLLTKFGEIESEHATLVAEKLTELGGSITWSFKPGEELKKPLRQILEEHADGERAAIALYEAAIEENLGLEYDKLFSRLLRDEHDHLRMLTELLERLQGP